MNYTLIGSRTSPFARRLRLLMEHIPHEFREMNIFDSEEAIELNKLNPINQIPVLLHAEKTIWHSRQIFNYLNSLHKLQPMDWKDDNLLTAIESAMDSGISLLLMKRSGMQIDEPYMFVERQKDRIRSVLDYLTPYIKELAVSTWDFQSMSLYCFLDWAAYRELLDLKDRPECLALLKAHANRPILKLTEIPKV